MALPPAPSLSRYVASRVDVATAPRVLSLALDERCDELERAVHRFLAHEQPTRDVDFSGLGIHAH